jgi:hypothetical protein
MMIRTIVIASFAAVSLAADGLARVTLPDSGRTGVLLVQAKSYPLEMYSNGCSASEVSRTQILEALQQTRCWLPVSPADWTGLYQSAIRLAHLYFMRDLAGETRLHSSNYRAAQVSEHHESGPSAGSGGICFNSMESSRGQ